MNVNTETIQKLFVAFRDDQETLETIESALMTFEGYHRAIYELEVKRRLYSDGAMEGEAYREMITRLDKTRTINHNALLTQVNILNRIAAEVNLPPFYEGVVSEERPYRREVANAVLDYVHQVILNRS